MSYFFKKNRTQIYSPIYFDMIIRHHFFPSTPMKNNTEDSLKITFQK